MCTFPINGSIWNGCGSSKKCPACACILLIHSQHASMRSHTSHTLLTHSHHVCHIWACTIDTFHSIYVHITIILWYSTSCIQVCNLKNFHGRKFTSNTTGVYKPTTTNNILFHIIIKWYCISADIRYQHKRFFSLSTVLNLHIFVL